MPPSSKRRPWKASRGPVIGRCGKRCPPSRRATSPTPCSVPTVHCPTRLRRRRYLDSVSSLVNARSSLFFEALGVHSGRLASRRELCLLTPLLPTDAWAALPGGHNVGRRMSHPARCPCGPLFGHDGSGRRMPIRVAFAVVEPEADQLGDAPGQCAAPSRPRAAHTMFAHKYRRKIRGGVRVYLAVDA